MDRAVHVALAVALRFELHTRARCCSLPPCPSTPGTSSRPTQASSASPPPPSTPARTVPYQSVAEPSRRAVFVPTAFSRLNTSGKTSRDMTTTTTASSPSGSRRKMLGCSPWCVSRVDLFTGVLLSGACRLARSSCSGCTSLSSILGRSGSIGCSSGISR